MKSRKSVLIQVIVLLPILMISCSGKQKPPSPQVVSDTAAYSLALDACKAEGKDAGKYDVYELCAQKADIKYGRKDSSK